MHTCTYNLGDQRLSDTLELESEVAMSYQIRVLDGYQGLPQKLLRGELSHLPSLTETFSWSAYKGTGYSSAVSASLAHRAAGITRKIKA